MATPDLLEGGSPQGRRPRPGRVLVVLVLAAVAAYAAVNLLRPAPERAPPTAASPVPSRTVRLEPLAVLESRTLPRFAQSAALDAADAPFTVTADCIGAGHLQVLFSRRPFATVTCERGRRVERMARLEAGDARSIAAGASGELRVEVVAGDAARGMAWHVVVSQG